MVSKVELSHLVSASPRHQYCSDEQLLTSRCHRMEKEEYIGGPGFSWSEIRERLTSDSSDADPRPDAES